MGRLRAIVLLKVDVCEPISTRLHIASTMRKHEIKKRRHKGTVLHLIMPAMS